MAANRAVAAPREAAVAASRRNGAPAAERSLVGRPDSWLSSSPSGHVADQALLLRAPGRTLQKAVRAPIDLCLLSSMAAAA